MKSKEETQVQLSKLVDMISPSAVFEEVKYNFIHFYPISEFNKIRVAYKDFNNLFNGSYPGYKSCNTKYHDKIHTMDTVIAISRLIDGYNLKNKKKLPVKEVEIALISALFHDSGFIQKETDARGTGAKYTLKHIERSINFIQKYFTKKLWFTTKKDVSISTNIIRCTGLSVDISKIKFNTPTERILGFMMGSADLLGQMAARNYLEKLLLLYHEFTEGRVPGYDSELKLLTKTIQFYEFVRNKLQKDFNGVHRYMKMHFVKRYNIETDLYESAIKNQIDYLKKILKNYPQSYKDKLRREVVILQTS